MKNVMKRWSKLAISRRVALLRWALPVAIIVFVVLYQTVFVNFMHIVLGDRGHYVVELLLYGVLGPLVTFFVLSWIRRWLVEKERIEHKVKEQGKRLALIRTEEGKRVAQHLHREVLPNLAYVHTKMDHIQGQLSGSHPDPQKGAREMVSVMGTLRETIGELRDKINALRKGSPFKSLKADSTLAEELEKRAQELKHLLQLELAVDIQGDENALPFELKAALWRVIVEALNNTALHAQAKRATVRLAFDHPEYYCATLSDDGVGFDVRSKQASPTGLGLVNMASEVEDYGGTLQVVSAPGAGTTVAVKLPKTPKENA